MNNIELRWLERPTGVRGMNEHGYYYDKTERVLQYRTKIRVVDYSLMEHYEAHNNHTYTWSAWIDVPVSVE